MMVKAEGESEVTVKVEASGAVGGGGEAVGGGAHQLPGLARPHEQGADQAGLVVASAAGELLMSV